MGWASTLLGVTMYQWIAIIILVVLIVFYVIYRRRQE